MMLWPQKTPDHHLMKAFFFVTIGVGNIFDVLSFEQDCFCNLPVFSFSYTKNFISAIGWHLVENPYCTAAYTNDHVLRS